MAVWADGLGGVLVVVCFLSKAEKNQKIRNCSKLTQILFFTLSTAVMKNCIVKMVVKNRNRTNPEDQLRSEATEEMLNSPNTPHASRNSEEKEAMGGQFKLLLGSFQKLLKEVNKLNKAHEIQPRDRKVVFQLPVLKGGQIEEVDLKQWITNLCTEVLSAAFHYFEQGKMSYDQTKIYCSENIICNIIRLNQSLHLNSDQIKMIDNHIEDGVAPYLLTKFPMTETVVVNKALESEIKEIDNIQALQNDLFYYSNDSFGFEYRESGNYNDLIMKLVNQLMKRIDDKENKPAVGNNRIPTFYEQFYEFIQHCFEKLESREWMDGQAPAAKDQLAKRTDQQKYRARVKSYTSYAIGRKISQNVSQYSQAEITSMHMTIKNPAILRILTKWCEQLWTKFEKKNYFLDRTENVKCQKGGNVNTYFAWMKQIVNDMVEEEKLEIERYLEQIFANNYDQQAIHCFRSLRGNSFSHVERFEKAAGIFTVNIVNNLHSYIIHYLNRLIHGLLKVSKRVYDRELIGRARWNSPPNLISFKIGDLMRCKIGSQQRQILKLFKHLTKLSDETPKEFKIIRIKNRLKEGTNDILMNFRFKDIFICQAQLAVNSDHSNFIKCSNKYNHFIYEVKRSIFGPISQLCSIWRSLDGRFKIYEKMADSKQIKDSSRLKSTCQLEGRSHSMQRYNQPFVCSSCKLTYSHNNYIWSHNRCELCTEMQCCRCRIDAEEESSLQDKLFKGNADIKPFAKQVKGKEEIPKYGACFMIESKQLTLQRFVKLNLKGKVGLYYRRANGAIDLISQLNTKKEVDAFRDKYIIFKFPVAQGGKIVSMDQKQAKNKFILPKLVKNIYKKEKQFISLIGQNIDDKTLEQTLAGSAANRNLIRILELPDNKLTSIDYICNNFSNLTRLVLSRNQIKNIDSVAKLISLQHLNIRDNLLQQLPLCLFNGFKIESLNIRANKIKVLPEEISKLTNLTKIELNQLGLKALPESMAKMEKLQYIDLSKNQLGEVPVQLRSLKRLTHLGLNGNGIKELPEWIGELTQMKDLQLNKNKIKSIPDSIANLKQLIQLQLENNCFQTLDFKCPQSLSVLILNENKINDIDEGFFVNLQNLVKLELNKNEINSLPMNMGLACRMMKSLSLNSNKLTRLPDFVTIFLPSLEVLQLKGNLFKNFPGNAILNCTQLVELYLSDNPQFDDDIPTPFLDNNFKIEKFDFSNTSLTRLPKDLNLAGTLKRLNFSGTKISCEQLELLSGLQYLEELTLSRMNLPALPKALKSQHVLHILNADQNQLTAIDDDFFDKLTHLRILNFSKNQIQLIPASISHCRRIKAINFDGNLLTEFPSALFELTRLEKIVLSNNQIESLDFPKPLPPNVAVFDLKNNRINKISSAFFRGAEKLASLDLSGNQIKTHPSELRECPNLEKTDFTGNPMELPMEQVLRETFTSFMSMGESDMDQVVNKESLMGYAG